jgi:DNA polymerase IV
VSTAWLSVQMKWWPWEDMPRKIIHLDLDAFFCAVEELQNPELKGRPFAVGGQADERGVISSCSYAARVFGVRSAMPTGRALGLCPGLLIIPPHHRLYSEASQQVMDRLHQWTALVEQISIDEAFLDLSDLTEDVESLARRLQGEIRNSLGLPCSLGVATNKLVAKIATDVGKAANRSNQPPNAITVVAPGQETAFLAPLNVQSLWGVGPKTAARLAELGIRTIGDLTRWEEADLVKLFGKNGYDLARHARGIDDSPLVMEHGAKSISQEVTFSRDVLDPEALRRTLRDLAKTVGRHLRQERLCGSTIKIKLRWPNFTTLTRQVTLSQPTDQDEEIYNAALALLEKHRPPRQLVRLLGVGVSGISSPNRQLSLWDMGAEKNRRLQSALDELREKYGDDIVHQG